MLFDQFSGNLRHTSYKLDFMWDLERFKHSKKDLRYAGEYCFSQGNITGLVKNSDRVVPSAPFYHWCVSQVEKWLKNESLSDFALVQINKVRDLFISDFEKGIMTSTRVFYGENRVEHLWNQNGIGKFSVNIKMKGNNSYLHDLRGNGEGRNIAKAILGAWQPVVDLDQMYDQLLGVKNGVYCYGINQKGERAVGLYLDVYYFVIDALINLRSCRLVVARQVN